MKKNLAEKNIENQINRIKGQIEGVSKMIDGKRDFNEIVIQISAVRAALSRLARDILKVESEKCFECKTREEKQKKFEHLVSSFFKIS